MAGRTESRGGLLLPLLVATFLLHLPALGHGLWQDDLVVLHRCTTLPVPAMLRDGISFHRSEIGDPWWLDPPVLARYFRPLLMASFRLVAVASTRPWAQHVVNLALHLLLVALLARWVGRRRGPGPGAVAAAVFAFSPHAWLPVHWIVARKELFVALFFLLGFEAHRRGRPVVATACGAAAMATGEHGVMFVFLLAIWRLTGRPGDGDRPLPSWFWPLQGLVLAAYLWLRHAALGGFPTPIAPYYNDPGAVTFLPYTAMKLAQFVLSLVTGLPYVDRVFMVAGLDHVALGAVMLVLPPLVVVLLHRGAGTRGRDFLRHVAMALAVHAPFVMMSACLFYPYGSQLFWAMALGIVWPAEGPSEKGRHLPARALLLPLLFLQGLLSFGLSWGVGDRDMAAPQRIWEKLKVALRGREDRDLVLVDVPGYASHLAGLRERETSPGATPVTLVLTARGLPAPDAVLRVRRHDDGRGIDVTVADDAPWFVDPLERWLLYLRDGFLEEGRSVERDGYEIRVGRVLPRPGRGERGRRFFCSDGGLSSLSLRWTQVLRPPLLVLFRGEAFRVVEPGPAGSEIEFAPGRSEIELAPAEEKLLQP